MEKEKLIIVLCVFMSTFTYAQQGDTLNAQPDTVQMNCYDIKVSAINHGGNIILRWAPDDPFAWKLLNRYGYRIERFTILKNGKAVDEPVKTELAEKYMPAPEQQWAQDTANKYAMILAQAIYGESFETQGKTQAGGIISRIKENEARYTYGLLAADMSLRAAELAGLAYTDKNMDTSLSYLYKVIPLIPPDKACCDTGVFFIHGNDFIEYLPVEHIRAETTEQTALIRWNSEMYAETYTGYIIERSTDNKHYERVNEDVFVPVKENNRYRDDHCIFTDSLPNNNKKFYYRIIGVSGFGIQGPPSEPVCLKARPMLKGKPEITTARVAGDTLVLVEWAFEYGASDSVEFYLLHAKRPDQYFERKMALDNSMKAAFSQTKPSMYYKIEAVDKHDYHYYSTAQMIQLVDSLPPPPPVKLHGKIDTNGNVAIRWGASKAPDIEGYKLFYANDSKHEFSQLNGKIINDTVYRYKTNLNTLTKNIYVKVRAFDHHFNPSGFSETLLLKRPDTIPPVAPDFTINIDSLPVSVQWEASFSKDVAGYEVMCKAGVEKGWHPVKNIAADKVFACKDSTIKKPGEYAYRVIAIDSAGNRSRNAKPFHVNIPASMFKKGMPDIQYQVDKEKRQIVFAWQGNNIKKVMIYKRVADNPLTLYKAMAADNNKFTDIAVNPGIQYAYRFRFAYQEAGYSNFSDEYIINF